ncbi:MAG: response regulator [Synergistaceae bacterium]|nr:response regulator [Synergistaceae bacterium]
MLTYGFNIWIEVAVIPFLAVMVFFLFARYGTNNVINKRFRALTTTTFFAVILEIFSTMLVEGWGHERIVNLIILTFYYFITNLNAYYLMRYIEAYVNVKDKKFDNFNRFLIVVSIVMLFFNTIPGFSGFFFIVSSDGAMSNGTYNTLCRSVFVIYFVVIALYIQMTNKDSYTDKKQYFIFNLLVGILVVANITQYMFLRMTLFTYAVSCLVLCVMFFYYESPTYRRMHTVEKELEDARVQVEQSTRITNAANKAKSNFLANTSHEIRTPMNAILGMNEMILKESKDSEIHQAALDIRKAGNHLLSIINNILDISKIESGKMELYQTDYHLWQLLRDIEEGHFETIHKKNLEFVLDIDKSIPEHLYGDEDKIRQILNNLIENAVKYTSKGKITLKVNGSLEAHDKFKLRMAVIDTGIGIRAEDLGKLFQSFERVNLNETQNIQGAGLGLTLVRYLVELMEGKVGAQSVYGQGSTFTLVVPQLLAQEGFRGTFEEYEKLYANERAMKEENTNFTCPDAEILIVDDTPVNLVVAKGMLKDSRAKVTTAESGEDCLELIKTKHYDIIFLDHKMPGMDGIETLNAAHEMEGPSQLSKYIALTANSGATLREDYISKGFNHYLPKPIKADALKKILSRYLPDDLKIKA